MRPSVADGSVIILFDFIFIFIFIFAMVRAVNTIPSYDFPSGGGPKQASSPGLRRAPGTSAALSTVRSIPIQASGAWKKENRNGDQKRQPRRSQAEAAEGEAGSGSFDSVGDRQARTRRSGADIRILRDGVPHETPSLLPSCGRALPGTASILREGTVASISVRSR